jgi:hypothetical protein
VHGIKELSTHSIATKAWGVGGAIDLDQWVKRTTFRIHFDWTMYRKKDEMPKPKYQRLCGGISALYTFPIARKTEFRCGLELNFTQLKYSYINGFEIVDTVPSKPITLMHTGNFIGIGPHLDVNYELTPRIKVALNFVPVYLIPVKYKVSDKVSDPEFKKGVWLFPIQLGFSFLIYKPDN